MSPRAQITWPAAAADGSDLERTRQRCAAEAVAATERVRSTEQFTAWPGSDAPSQTPADADRDGVAPGLATRALSERAAPLAAVATEEGIWAIGAVPNLEPDQCLDGSDGRRRACGGDAELLLVDDHQDVVLAVPLRGQFAPTWLLVTADAVYAGQDAQRQRAETALVRVDRSDLTVEVLAFDAPPGVPVIGVPLSMRIPETWRLAATSPPPFIAADGDGLLASSTDGEVTRVDLATVAAAFE